MVQENLQPSGETVFRGQQLASVAGSWDGFRSDLSRSLLYLENELGPT